MLKTMENYTSFLFLRYFFENKQNITYIPDSDGGHVEFFILIETKVYEVEQKHISTSFL